MVTTEKSVPASPVKSYSLALACTFLMILCISYSFNSADRQILPMLLPWISKEYGYSLQDAGLLSTVFTLGSAVIGIPIGYVLDHSSRKTVMMLGLAIYSVFTILTVYAHGFWDMLFYLAMSGIGEGMQIAGIYAALGSYFSRTRTLALGCLVIAYGVGGFLGPTLGTRLTLAYNNWHIPFIAFGIAGLIMTVMVLLFVPKGFTESKNQSGMGSTAAAAHMPENLWNRNVVLCAVAAVITGFSLFGFISLYATYLIQVLKYPPMNAGLAFSFFGLGGIMSLVGGWCGDRFKQHWVIGIAFAGASVVGYLMYNVVTSFVIQCLMAFMTGTFCSGFLYLNVMSLLQRSVRPEMVGRASGIFVTSIYLSAVVAGWMFAKLVATFGWGGAASIELSVLPLIGIISMALIKPDQLITAKPKKENSELV
jgi:MFS family permease